MKNTTAYLNSSIREIGSVGSSVRSRARSLASRNQASQVSATVCEGTHVSTRIRRNVVRSAFFSSTAGAESVKFGWFIRVTKLCNMVCQLGMFRTCLPKLFVLCSRQWKCLRNLCIEIEPESRDAVMRSLGAGADEVQENSPLMMPRASALRYVVLTYVMSFSRLHVLL